jgi:hypothetical protein
MAQTGSSCEARKGVMLAFAFVASPFDRDPAGARSWLVGFLLHPVPRTGTWRRLVSPGLGPTPGAGLLRFQRSWRTCRLGGKTANRQHLNFTGFAVFSQGLVQPLWINKLLVFLNLHAAKPWMKGAECYPHPFTQSPRKIFVTRAGTSGIPPKSSRYFVPRNISTWASCGF